MVHDPRGLTNFWVKTAFILAGTCCIRFHIPSPFTPDQTTAENRVASIDGDNQMNKYRLKPFNMDMEDGRKYTIT